MWQNVQANYNGYLYYKRNCSNPGCLNPYCQCGDKCRCNNQYQCSAEWGSKPVYTQKTVDLISSMRLVWSQHIYWTRLAIISILFSLPDVDFTLTRLLRNATDNGEIFKPYYGNEIAGMYSDLIREHLVIAAELVKAAKVGDEEAVAAIDKRWHKNAEDIAEFLSRINPFISRDAFQKMLFEHLALTTQEAVLILQNDYQSSIAVTDEIEVQALQMADTITDAIVKQFPSMF